MEPHPPLWWILLAAMGLVVGVIAGMFGVGGGFLLTPLLSLAFRVPLPVAVGTGLCQMIGVAVSALIRHQRLRQGEVKIDWMMLAGSLLGVGLGVQTVDTLSALGQTAPFGHPVSWARVGLSSGYVLLLGGVAAWMRRDLNRPGIPAALPAPAGPLTRLYLPPMTRLPRSGHRVSAPLMAYIGLFMGFLSGLLGIGGGVALMPILMYGIGMHTRMAAGTGILVLLASSLAGTAAHARAGHVDLGVAVCLLVGSTVGTQIGATLTARLNGQRLRGLFVYLVLLTAVAVAFDLARAAFGWGGG